MKDFDSLKACGLALLNEVNNFIGAMVILEVAFWISTNLASLALYGDHSQPIEELDFEVLYLIVLCCVPPLLSGLFCGAISQNIWIVMLGIIAAESFLFLYFMLHSFSLPSFGPGLVILLNPMIMFISAFAGCFLKVRKSG